MMSEYRPPEIRDYGSIAELTKASGLAGVEDGGAKAVTFHDTAPVLP